MEVGAGTFHPATTLRSLGPEALESRLRSAVTPAQGWPLRREPQSAAALLSVSGDPEAFAREPCRSSISIRSPRSASTWRLHDVRFVEDDWESPTLGAWGLGWECWCDGMEVSQFTYFQQVAGFECAPVSGELTYGLERLAMYVQGVESVYDLNFNGGDGAERVAMATCSCRRSRNIPASTSSTPTPTSCSSISRTPKPNACRCSSGASRANATSWRFRPMTSASRRAMSSICSTRAAPYRSPSARAIS